MLEKYIYLYKVFFFRGAFAFNTYAIMQITHHV